MLEKILQVLQVQDVKVEPGCQSVLWWMFTEKFAIFSFYVIFLFRLDLAVGGLFENCMSAFSDFPLVMLPCFQIATIMDGKNNSFLLMLNETKVVITESFSSEKGEAAHVYFKQFFGNNGN